MTFRDYAAALRRSWWLVLLCIAIGVAAAGLYTQSRTPVYSADSQLFLSVTTPVDADEDSRQDTAYLQQRMPSYVGVLSSPMMGDRVARALGLDESGQSVAERITAETGADTVLIDVSVRDESPEVAQRISAVLGDELGMLLQDLESVGPDTAVRVKVATIQPPVLPTEPVSPQTPLVLALGLALGLAAGVSLALLRAAVSDGPREPPAERTGGRPHRAADRRLSQEPGEMADNMLSRTGAVCILHGDPGIPRWLVELAETVPMVIVVNDPAPGRYADVPPAMTVLTNPLPLGFAENVSQAMAVLTQDASLETFLVLNFDLQLEVPSLVCLVDALRERPQLAAVGPLMFDADGSPVLSVGRLPRPHVEFLRAAGMRQGAWLRAQRAVLRRSRGWSRRNNVAGTEGARVMQRQEYLPWTCVAVRREAWEKVGGLDTRFQMYAEDIDWSVRAANDGWGLAVVRTTPPVVHGERWTRSPVTDAWYEASHVKLHRKYGRKANLRSQRLGLALRRLTPLRWTSPLAWSEIEE